MLFALSLPYQISDLYVALRLHWYRRFKCCIIVTLMNTAV